MSVLVTGATGFLGRHVINQLLLQGEQVHALVRRESQSLARLGERATKGQLVQVAGNIRDAESLTAACDDMACVFHLAGLVSRDQKDTAAMMRVHVDGTRHLLSAAKDAGVGRVIVASSSGTLCVSDDPDFVGHEDLPHAIGFVKDWPYYLSKIYQERLALSFFKEHGLPIVILNPSLLLGPGDARGSSTDDVRRFLQRKIPSVPSGGINFVDVRDCAKAFVSAIENGQPGERYLLGGPNWTFKTFFGRLERLSKVRGPRLRLPDKLARVGASIIEQLADWRGTAPAVDRISVTMAEHFWYVDSSKAEQQLGFESRDPQETLIDTVRYLRKHFLGDEGKSQSAAVF